METILENKPAEKNSSYIMESRRETFRLEIKTGFEVLKDQAVWAGIKPGMRAADIGCGTGKTSSFLKTLVGSDGEVTGVDRSKERLEYAVKNYAGEGIDFIEKDIYKSLSSLGQFDFIWVRFLLEYHRSRQFELVERFVNLLAPGGIICLADLDLNCINHYGWSGRLKRAVEANVALLEENFDFDPYAGKKLYTCLYDLNMKNIKVRVDAHNLIYGQLDFVDEMNWLTKVDVACRSSGYDYPEYPGGFDEFYKECRDFFTDPRRFTYTPLVLCRGSI